MNTCPFCGYKTVGVTGCHEICPICFWEDDSVQEADPWVKGGENSPTLFQAQINFKKYGAMEERFVSNVRLPNSGDKKDPKWIELVEADKEFCTTPREIEKAWGSKNSLSYNYWERNA